MIVRLLAILSVYPDALLHSSVRKNGRQEYAYRLTSRIDKDVNRLPIMHANPNLAYENWSP
jgi:hypothetical protein